LLREAQVPARPWQYFARAIYAVSGELDVWRVIPLRSRFHSIAKDLCRCVAWWNPDRP
jgi:hypothetical protein